MLMNKEDLEAINTLNHKECFEQGYSKALKDVLEMFKFELDNRVTSYETLEKLDKLKEQISKSEVLRETQNKEIKK